MADIMSSIDVADTSSLSILSPASRVLQQMSETYQHIKFGRKRCKAVIQQAYLITEDVHGSLKKGQVSHSDITKLHSMLEEIQGILQSIAGLSFFKALLHFEDVNKNIERACGLLAECSKLFLMANLSSQNTQSRAAMSDQEALRAHLQGLAGNYEEIRHRFGIYSKEQEDQALAAMERELNTRVTSEEDMPVELQIMQKSLECIETTTGRRAPKQGQWLITEYDLEYCGAIGGGGFATVQKARFRGMMVAVKIFKDDRNMREVLEREVEVWSRLRHDHIVPFYGASVLTSPPFIVSRYMQNGNLIQYLARTPGADRTKLLLEVSLGMYYLHEEAIVHGDLKGVNVLVDDAGKACITDFGLSKVCTSETGGSQTSKIAGTLRFLAPEALRGYPLSFETDVYAFGMLIFEVFTGEAPFIGEPDMAVIQDRVVLQRPTSDEVYERGFNDALWQLLSGCTSREPSTRPRFKMIQTSLTLLKKEPSAQSVDPVLLDEDGSWIDCTPRTTSPESTFDGAVPLPKVGGSIFNLVDHLKKGNAASVDQTGISSERSFTHDTKAPLPTSPMCILITTKYFDVPFGIASQEPSVYLQKAGMAQWQPIKANKGTQWRKQGNGILYMAGPGNESNTWDLCGNKVTLSTLVNTVVCRFRHAHEAQKWFMLQSSYARNGSLGDWDTAMGDLFYTERSWRRFVRDKIQRADLVENAPKEVPTDRSWSDANLPERCIIIATPMIKNRVDCITNPGKEPGKLCCKLEGRTIISETYRFHKDEWPGNVIEEIYPSKEYAEAMFHALKVALEKAAEN